MKMELHRIIFLYLSTLPVGVKCLVQVVLMAPKITPPSSVIFVNASTSVGAFALAIEEVYNEGILPRGTFSILWIDDACDSKQSIGKFTDFLFGNRVDVIFGPPCTTAMIPIAELAAYRQIPVYGWLSNESTLDDKNKLQTLIRVIPPLSNLGGILAFFFLGFNWLRLVMVSSADPECNAYADAFLATFESSIWSNLGFLTARHYKNVEVNTTTSKIDSMWSSIKTEARIVILIIPEDELRTYMIRAYKLGIADGSYQFIFIKTTIPSETDLAILLSRQTWEHGDDDDTGARQGYENVLYVTFGSAYQENTTSWSSSAYTAYQSLHSTHTSLPDWAEPDIYSPFLHDAVYLYALTLASYGGDPTKVNGSTIFQSTDNFMFQGLSGDVVMSYTADRYPSITVFDLSESGQFNVVAFLRYAIVNGFIETQSNLTVIRWGNGRTSVDFTPLDTPACGFYNENCPPADNSSQLALYIGLALGMMVVLLIIFFMYRMWKRERDLSKVAWKISSKDVDFLVGKQIRSFMNLSADDPGSESVLSPRKGSEGEKNLRHRRSSFLSRAGTENTYGMTTNTDTISTDCKEIQTSKISAVRYRGRLMAVKYLHKRKLKTDNKKLLKEMKQVLEFKNANIATMIGICTDVENTFVLWEYCSKGSLQDVIEHEDIKLDTMFKISIAADICKGLIYLHKSDLRFHGNLKSTNCLIDSRWTCKLTDFGPRHVQGEDTHTRCIEDHEKFSALFWTAPEILRKVIPTNKRHGSPAGDVYSFAIIAKELICRDGPYSCENQMTPEEIINKVMNPGEGKRFRPAFPLELDGVQTAKQSYAIKKLIQSCWIEDPMMRPTTKTILKALNKINPYKKTNVIENMIVMMEKYSNQLEEIVAERTSQLQEEKRKTDALLYRMLPRKVAEELKLGRPVEAEAFDSVTVYFSDIVGFTTLAGGSTPMQVIDLLNALYTLFDDKIENYRVYKVETIGDAYMIVSGLPERNGNNHANEIAKVALELLDGVKRFQVPHKPEERLKIRIGIHSGPVCAGVVGLTMPRYCLFGDTVNTASRMESNGQALKIHISASTCQLLNEEGYYTIVERGQLDIKGKGTMTTYWLEGKSTVENTTTPIQLSSGDLGTLNDQRASDNDERKSGFSEEVTDYESDTGSSVKYLSFFNMPSLPNAGDIISDDSGLLDLFDESDDGR